MGLGKLLAPGQSSMGAATLAERRKRQQDNSEGGPSSSGAVGTAGWQSPEVLSLRHSDAVPVGTGLGTGSAETHYESVDRVASDGEMNTLPASASSSALPATVEAERMTRSDAQASDMWAVGCVTFHVLAAGGHPFGDNWFEREANVMRHQRVRSPSTKFSAVDKSVFCFSSQLIFFFELNFTCCIEYTLLQIGLQRLSHLPDAYDLVRKIYFISFTIFATALLVDLCASFL